MALAIDTTVLTREWIPWRQQYLDNFTGDTCLQIYRVCVHTIVFHDASNLPAVKRQVLARQEALDWEADEDDDLDEVGVFHHLKQQAQTSPWLAEALTQTERTNATTSLVASCAVQSPSLIASGQRRPLSSFHRYSFRQSSLISYNTNISLPQLHGYLHSSKNLLPSSSKLMWWPIKTVGARNEPWIAWQLQYDIVDLLSRRSHPTWRPEKRRRSTVNPFHRVSSSPPVEDTHHLPEAKRFNGVRYRDDRKTWTAEMKPPKYKNKVYFGEFKSQIQAARVVDVAFYYYDKPRFLNFPDTPRMLSIMPTPAGLGVEDKLRFVKEQAKRVSSIASTLPSSPAFVTCAIPDSSVRDCKADNPKFGSFSELASFLSCGDADEADDGISQPQSSLQLDSMVSNGLMEPNLVATDTDGFVSVTLQEQQGLLQWNSEDGFADPCLSTWWSPSSSMHITDRWDGAEHSSAPALTDFVTPLQPSFILSAACE